MARIVSNVFTTVDGVVEAPDRWHLPYFDDAMAEAMGRATEDCSAFLMGRTTYEEWLPFWPPQGDSNPFAALINSVDKYVLSTTLTEATWSGTQIIDADAAARVGALKADLAGDICISGSATTVRWLLGEGLLDEIRLMVDPVAVGDGRRLFEGVAATPLRLVHQECFPTGVLNLAYAPAWAGRFRGGRGPAANLDR